MKTILKASIILAGAFIIAFSCTKENEISKTSKENNITGQEISAADKQTQQKILDFKERVKSNEKDGGEISAGEALWCIEAALNYTFCMDAGPAVDPETDTNTIQFTLNDNGQIEFTDVAIAYITVAGNMANRQAQLEDEEREFKIVDVEDITTSAQLNAGTIVMKISAVTGVMSGDGNGSARGQLYTFGPDDNWYYGGGMGMYPSGYEGWDAARLFSNVMNYGEPMPDPLSLPAYPGYFTDVEIYEINHYKILSEYRNPGSHGELLDNILDYLIFYRCAAHNGGEEPDLVLWYAPYDQMNFYMQNIQDIKLQLDEDFGGMGKSFKCCKVIDESIEIDEFHDEIWHELEFSYGIHHEGAHH